MQKTTPPGMCVGSTECGMNRTSRLFSLLAVAFIATGFLLLSPGQAAATIISLGDAQVVAGESGYIDVWFEVTDETNSLAAYQLELIVSGPDSGVHFTGFAEPLNAIFPGQEPIKTASRPELPGSIAAANDFIFTGENPIENGTGIIRVLFDTDIGSLGVYDVVVDTNIVRTNFSNGSGELIPIDQFVAGTITVVPEPSSLLLFCGVILAGLFMRRCPSRRILITNEMKA